MGNYIAGKVLGLITEIKSKPTQSKAILMHVSKEEPRLYQILVQFLKKQNDVTRSNKPLQETP